MQQIIAILLAGLITSAHADTLTLLNWEGYLSEEVIKAWEARSGHKIEQVYFDNDEDRDNVLVGHKNKVIDLVVIDETANRIFGNKGTFVALTSYENVQNLNLIDKNWQKNCGPYGIPYLWGTLGISYRTDKVSLPPTSWDFILNPADSLKGHIGLIDDYVDTLAPVLIGMNKSINSDHSADLRQAFNIMKSILPSILTFEYSISFVDADESRDELYVALTYSGDQYTLNEKAGKNIWQYTTLKEGTIAWVDCLALMKDSPRKDIAYDFLNYLYSPKVAAENSESIYVASPIKAARDLQSEEFLADESVYPPVHIMENAQYYKVLNPANTLLRNRITSSLIKLHETQ